uniref:Zinc finger GRF-type domain-containing protein n=1 Tax=Lactuca sativa TaxID=4236 RepID=A0A9R1V7L4_LACSA|nr:hypothetical protein LSAT_V11C600316570 [Lactuca sativa]
MFQPFTNNQYHRLLHVLGYVASTWLLRCNTHHLRGIEKCLHYMKDELQPDHQCDGVLPSREKTSRTPDNPGTKFKVCQNSLNGKSSSCKFWQWFDEDEGRKDGRRHYMMKPEESCNLTLKICTLENEINIYRMEIVQEKNNNKQELDKVSLKLFTHRLALIVLLLLYVKMLF